MHGPSDYPIDELPAHAAAMSVNFSSRARSPWSDLLKRVWGIEALRCSKCGGWRTICASITDGMVARKILLWAGIDPDLPRFEPLRC